jgi:hypothetical protein
VVHVLDPELDRHREVLDDCDELALVDPLGEIVERLAVGALLLVELDPALDRIGNALRGEPDL